METETGRTGVRRLRITRAHLLMAAVYSVARIAFYSAGVRFDDSGLAWYWQFLDEPLLRDRLLESLWYLHSQPPAFNLYAGAMLKLFPSDTTSWFHASFLAMGFIAYLLVHGALLRAGYGNRAAFLLATAFTLAPETVLFENWLFYTWPVAFMLLAAMTALARYEQTRRAGDGTLFVALCAAVCLTRSAYHLVWLGGAALIALSVPSARRRQVVAACAVAGTLVAGVAFKNLAIFGTFGTSSWLGMSLWHFTTHAVPVGSVEALVREGVLTDIALTEPFRDLVAYPARFSVVPARFAAVPALAATRKAGGVPNFNHYGYIELSREYLRTVAQVHTREPARYLAAQGRAWLVWLIPAWDYDALAPNREAMGNWFEAATLLGPRRWLERRLLGGDASLYPRSLLVAVPFAAGVVAAALALGAFTRRKVPRSTVFAVLTVLYVAAVGNAVEFGENHRFRAETDPLLYVLALASARELWVAWRSRSRV